MPTESIMYYKSHLQALTTQQSPIGELRLDGATYHYFTHLCGDVSTQEYSHHIGDLPLPGSFQLLDYQFQQGTLLSENHIPLTRAYPSGPTKFVLNVKQGEFDKITYEFEDGQFQPLSPLTTGNFLGWDYKKISDGVISKIESCGTKCRENIFHGCDPYKLLVFYSKENATEDRFYYIPCLGKVDCGKKEAANVVYFNATKSELIANWLTHFHGNPITDMLGIADELGAPIPQKVFTQGGTTVQIQYTADHSKLQYKIECKPKWVSC